MIKNAQKSFLVFFISLCVLVTGMTSQSLANKKYASIVMDADTGAILSQSRADKRLHPASLTKIMTLVMVFDALESGKIGLNDRIRISSRAASMVPSKLDLPVGSSIRVKDAVMALVTKSANDIAVAVGEHIAGSERNFAKQMTAKARAIGMRNTTFVNASGLHDRRQISTARDMAKLGRYSVYRYPKYYRYFSKTSFKYRGKSYKNHNKLLGSYDGVDGIKTGYVNASGFNLVASAQRDGRRIIGVVFGGKSSKRRNDHMVVLLDRGFSKVGKIRVASKRVPIPRVKPNIGGEVNIASNPNNKSMKTLNVSSMSFEQGDIDPKTSSRFDTGFMALKAHKSMSVGVGDVSSIIQAVNKNNDNVWGIQLGAFSSRIATETAIKTAKNLLPDTLKYSRNTISTLVGAGNQRIYRARLTGYNKHDAEKACSHFSSCMIVSPSVQ